MLRWHLLGIDFCIQPSFFFMNALWALLMAGPLSQHQVDNRFILVFILVWIACMFVSVMVHELGHVVVGRIFGQPGNITLTGMGGQTVGSYDALRPWQRILVILAGPLAGFALSALVIALDGTAWNRFMDHLITVTNSVSWENYKVRLFWIESTPLRELLVPAPNLYYVIAVSLMTFVNLFINILNLLPIIPMDGGMIFKEICCLLSPRQGLKIAFGFSFMLGLAVSLFYLGLVLETYLVNEHERRWLTPYYPFGFPEFSLIVFIMLTYRSLEAYWQLVAAERHSQYMQDDY